MKSVRSFFLTLAGLTMVAVAAVFTASIGLALIGAMAVLAFGYWLSAMIDSGATQQPARVYARYRARQREEAMRVWNDGKGTIIDM
ncbi:hypothetical protein H2O14_13265 [Rhizobium sp. G21]|nr:hypothetical protein [Rhizobium sp. G21]